MIRIPVESAGPGDMVLFRMRRGAIVKHVGILTESDGFVHSYDRLGVIEEPLTDAWRRRIAFAFRFPRPTRVRRKNP
jgi:NlpC/P60 family putative phage cell wall peptidase